MEHRGSFQPERPNWVSPFADKLLILFFAIFLASPALVELSAWWRGSGDPQILLENRDPAPVPAFRTDPLAALPQQIEAYFDDHFGFRAPLIRLYAHIVHQGLGASNADVIIGKDGWLFYARDNIFTDFFGLSPFSDDELKHWDRYLEVRRAMLAEKDIRYLFVVAPNKNTIYPETLPQYIQSHRGQSRLEQLKDYLKSRNSRVDLLDLHDALLAAKPSGVQYLPQDTHWNGRGYFTGYLALVERLRQWFPEISPQVLGRDYEIREAPWIGGEWGLLGLPEESLRSVSEFLFPIGSHTSRKVPAPAIPWIAKDKPVSTIYFRGSQPRSLLILHDSFMRTGSLDTVQIPLTDNFGRTLLIGGRRPSDHDLELIADVFHPDVIIEERVERNMAEIPQIYKTSFSPEVTVITPSHGRGASAAFTVSYASPPGAEDVGVTQIVVGSTLSPSHSCRITYSAKLNEFSLWDDTGEVQLPGASPGKGIVGNSQCTLLGAGSTASIAENRLIVRYQIQFKSSFAGRKRIWTNAYSLETGLDSAWKSDAEGAPLSWTVTGNTAR
jgi:hypothetical protein